MNKNNNEALTSEEYIRLIKKHSPKSPVFKNTVFAFFIGGFICFVGEWLVFLFMTFGIEKEISYLLVTILFIVLASLFTGLGFFDKIARRGGAGTLLPVTGFSNAVTSSAIDTRSEGLVVGVGSKIFTVAGPVILYSTLAGVIYGFIYFLICIFKSIY